MTLQVRSAAIIPIMTYYFLGMKLVMHYKINLILVPAPILTFFPILTFGPRIGKTYVLQVKT